MRLVIALFPFLTACTPDPGDVAVLEHSEAISRASVGTSIDAATTALVAYGYKCMAKSGEFVTESGKTASAPSFSMCSRHPDRDPICAIKTDVILVPQSGNIKEVHFHAGDVCL